MKKWKTLESHTIFKNQWFDVREEKVQVTEDLAMEGVLVHTFSDWVCVVPFTKTREILLVSQYRHGMGVLTTEVPSGSVEPDDPTPKDAAIRELFEETGYAAGQIYFIGKSQANPQMQNNYIHHFVALDCHLVSQPKPEIGGVAEFWLEPWDRTLHKVRAGEINHSSTVECVLRAEDWLRQGQMRDMESH